MATHVGVRRRPSSCSGVALPRETRRSGRARSRGLASLVFGLLAFLDLESPDDFVVIEVMVVVVVLSVIFHGLSAGPIAKAYGRKTEREAEP